MLLMHSKISERSFLYGYVRLCVVSFSSISILNQLSVKNLADMGHLLKRLPIILIPSQSISAKVNHGMLAKLLKSVFVSNHEQLFSLDGNALCA
jgi:hypothetical protein